MRKAPKERRLSVEELTSINRQFRREVDSYGLVYRCQDCIHVRHETLDCVLGYPNEMLALGEVRALDERSQYVFCKDFELEDS